jgi:hypothetical protein
VQKALLTAFFLQIQPQCFQTHCCLRFRHTVYILNGRGNRFARQTIESKRLRPDRFGHTFAPECSLGSKETGVIMGDSFSAAFGIFSDRLSTENAIETLRAAGFRNTDISSLFPDDICTSNSRPKGTKVFRGAAAGAAIGAFVGGAFWLVGSGAVSLPVTPIVTSLASLGTGSAVGTLLGALAGRRFPAYREHYEGRVRRGDTLVSVQCDNSQWTRKAMAILKRAGAEDISVTRKATPDSIPSSRPAVRPAREKTVAPPLRLVVSNRENSPRETSGTEVRKTVAS